jgi:hypothetical protein
MPSFQITCPHCQAAMQIHPVGSSTTVLCRSCENTVIWDRAAKPFPWRSLVFFGVGLTVALAAAIAVLAWALYTPRIGPDKAGNGPARDPSGLAPSPTVGGPERGFEVTFPDRPTMSKDAYRFETEAFVLEARVTTVPRYGAYAPGSQARWTLDVQGFDETTPWHVGGTSATFWRHNYERLHQLAFEVRHEQRVFTLTAKHKWATHDIETEFSKFLGTFRLLNGRDDDAAPAPRK